MKKIKILLLLFVAFFTISVNAQTPDGPLINGAQQVFLEDGAYHSTRSLTVDQYLSPRVLRPRGASEKIYVMYIGHWLDITDEVVVTGPNSNRASGLTFSRILDKGNGPCNTVYTTSKSYLPNYIGAYVVVEFLITDAAALGTHTVTLRRPRVGPGKDEARPFYLEVLNLERIHNIRFVEEGSGSSRIFGRVNETGKIYISGQNLGGIRLAQNINRLNDGGFFTNISEATSNDSSISFKATLAKTGMLGYKTLLPVSFQNAMYPIGEYNPNNQRYPGECQIKEAAENVPPPPPCRNYENSIQLVACVPGPCPVSPTLDVTIIGGVFRTAGSIILAADKAAHALCPAALASGAVGTVTVAALRVRITNTGDGVSTPTSLNLCAPSTNTNFSNLAAIAVPAIGTGAFVEFTIPRVENKVQVTVNGAGQCVQLASGANGINRWNDIGFKARLYYQRFNGTFASNAVIQ